MGRPSKDGRFVNFLMDNKIFEQLVKVANLQGCTKTNMIERALQQYIEPFLNAKGEIEPIEAIYVKSGQSCMVIDTIIIGNKKYCKIFTEGELLTVPEHDVVIDIQP